jgi:hypothetical protein
MSGKEISFNTRLSEQVKTLAAFTYKITPALISFTDTGLCRCSVADDIETVLRKIEYWHQGSVATFKIMCRDGKRILARSRGTAKPRPSLPWRKPTSEKLTRSCLGFNGSLSVRARWLCQRKPASLIGWRCATGYPHDREARRVSSITNAPISGLGRSCHERTISKQANGNRLIRLRWQTTAVFN